jgi:hypothetical protein
MTAEEWALAASSFFSGLAAGFLGGLCTIIRPMQAAVTGQAEATPLRPEPCQHRPILPGGCGRDGVQPHDLRAVHPGAGPGCRERASAPPAGIAALTILVITLMVAWVPLLLAAVVPGALTRLLPRLGGWMTANNRWIQVVLGFGSGSWLLVKGVNGLYAQGDRRL